MKLIILIVLLTSCVPNADTLERWGAARNEETKNVMMKDQTKILLDILKATKNKPIEHSGQKRVFFPLT